MRFRQGMPPSVTADAALERLKQPAALIAAFAALFVGFDVLVLLLNTLGSDVSVLNQASTVRRAGRSVRVRGLGLTGPALFAVNTGLLAGHAVLLGLALKLRSEPSRGLAVVTALYSLLPCLCPCVFFPLGLWLLLIRTRLGFGGSPGAPR